MSSRIVRGQIENNGLWRWPLNKGIHHAALDMELLISKPSIPLAVLALRSWALKACPRQIRRRLGVQSLIEAIPNTGALSCSHLAGTTI
jgi:hypothetical protein